MVTTHTFPFDFSKNCKSSTTFRIITSCCNNVVIDRLPIDEETTCHFFKVGTSVKIKRFDNVTYLTATVEEIDGSRIYLTNINNLVYPMVFNTSSCGGSGTDPEPTHENGTYVSEFLLGNGYGGNLYCSFSYSINLLGSFTGVYETGNSVLIGIKRVVTSSWTASFYFLTVATNISSSSIRSFSGTSTFKLNIDPSYSWILGLRSIPFSLIALSGFSEMEFSVSNISYYGCPYEDQGCGGSIECSGLTQEDLGVQGPFYLCYN